MGYSPQIFYDWSISIVVNTIQNYLIGPNIFVTFVIRMVARNASFKVDIFFLYKRFSSTLGQFRRFTWPKHNCLQVGIHIFRTYMLEMRCLGPLHNIRYRSLPISPHRQDLTCRLWSRLSYCTDHRNWSCPMRFERRQVSIYTRRKESFKILN